MPDQFLHQLPEGTDPNVISSDLVLVSRSSTAYRAKVDKAILPASAAGDSGKILTVNSSGSPAWGTPVSMRENIYSNTQGGGLNVSLSLDGTRRFNQYMGFMVGYGTGGSQAAWSSLFIYASGGSTNYAITNLRGTGWATLTTSGTGSFTITSSNSSFKVYRIDGVRMKGDVS